MPCRKSNQPTSAAAAPAATGSRIEHQSGCRSAERCRRPTGSTGGGTSSRPRTPRRTRPPRRSAPGDGSVARPRSASHSTAASTAAVRRARGPPRRRARSVRCSSVCSSCPARSAAARQCTPGRRAGGRCPQQIGSFRARAGSGHRDAGGHRGRRRLTDEMVATRSQRVVHDPRKHAELLMPRAGGGGRGAWCCAS